MRRVLNLILTALILGGASWLFPEIVQVDGVVTLIAAAVALWLIKTIVSYICFFATLVSAAIGDASLTIIFCIAVFLSQVIALYILTAYMRGFAVIGFWPKVFISICYYIFALGDNSKKSSSSN